MDNEAWRGEIVLRWRDNEMGGHCLYMGSVWLGFVRQEIASKVWRARRFLSPERTYHPTEAAARAALLSEVVEAIGG